MTKRMTWSLWTLAILALAFAAACGGPRQESKASPGQQPAGESEVAVKGAFDADDAGAGALPEKTPAEAEKARKQFSPYARKFPTHVYFGDTHHHTANSGDAFMAGDRLTPEQAYRFARGEEVVSSTGVPVRLSRPMDFLVVSDHAEGLGLMFQVYDGNPAFMADPMLAGWNKAMKGSMADQAKAANEVVSAQAQGTLPPVIKDPKVVGPILRSVWQNYTATAEKFNTPGLFTAMIGYEWTSVPGGNNLHRNVLFRDNKDKADQILPFSAWQSEDPEKLWEWMAKYEAKTGGKLLAIPHNGNLSNGRMFELVDFAGNPLSKDYAERRARWEVLQEMMQTKGSSEAHPALSPNDEFADFGIAGWEYGNLTLEGEPLSKAMMPTAYLRYGLLRGMELEQKLGQNPFKFGFVGGTDVHNSLTAIEEDNFFGKHVNQEPSATRWEHVSKQGFGKTRYTWHYTAAGLRGGLGHREHPRGAVGRDEAQGGLRHLRHAHDGALLRRLGLREERRSLAPGRGRGLRQGCPDGKRPAQGPRRREGPELPRRGDQGPALRQPRPHPDRQGLARQGRQGPGEDLRRRLG